MSVVSVAHTDFVNYLWK